MDLTSILAMLESKADVSALERMQKKLEHKAEKTDLTHLASQLQRLAPREDLSFLSSEFDRLKLEIDRNFIDIDKNFKFLAQQLENTTSGGEFNSASKRAALQERDRKLEALDERLTHEIYRISEELRDTFHDRFLDLEDSLHLVKETVAAGRSDLQSNRIREQIDELRYLIEETMSKKLDKKEFFEVKSRILEQVDSKVGLSELLGLKAEINSTLRETEDMILNSASARVGGIGTSHLSPQRESAQIYQRSGRRSGRIGHRIIRARTQSLDMPDQRYSHEREDAPDSAVDELKRIIERLQRDMHEKIDKHDLRILLDHKPGRNLLSKIFLITTTI